MSYWTRWRIAKFNPNHDEKGRFTTGGGVDRTDDAAVALKDLSENKRVQLGQFREVNTLMEDLRNAAKEAIKDGTKAKIYNLCNVSVAGTNLFCHGSKGINRLDMPQLKGKPIPGSPADHMPKDVRGEVDISDGFKQYLRNSGLTVTPEVEGAAYLKATQNELNGVKVAQIAQAIDQHKLDNAPLFVSRDNYIVDGHHRWAAMVGVDSESGKLGTYTVPVERVDDDIVDLLDRAKKYAASQGIPQTSLDKISTNVAKSARCGCGS